MDDQTCLINLPNISMISPLELDLAFTSDPKSLLDGRLNINDFSRLKNCELWSNDFKNWIEFIKANTNLLCPDVVRNNSSFSIGLQLTDDLTISQINARWRKKVEATDVLSFAALDNTIIHPISTYIELGDIIVSVETATIQAMENEHSLNTELRWLVSHGFLHLLGWNHPTDKKLTEMLRCQEKLLEISSEEHYQRDPIMS